MAGTPRALRYPRPNFFEELTDLGETAADAGQAFDGGLGIGCSPRRVVAEVGLQGRGVGIEGGGRGDVPELPDGLQPAIPVRHAERASNTGPRRSGQADDLGSRESVGRQPEDFHPPLHLGRRVMEPVGSDRGDDRRREIERSHGILPGRLGR
ncbi:MAG: hypothetical protein QM757_21495 [Paludibaculum sp.]